MSLDYLFNPASRNQKDPARVAEEYGVEERLRRIKAERDALNRAGDGKSKIVGKVGDQTNIENAPIYDPIISQDKVAPKVEAPVAKAPEAPYAPMAGQDAQRTLPSQVPSSVQAPQKEEGFPWERALIGATPLLVGMLTGNTQEGVQTSGEYFAKGEAKLYQDEQDLAKKLTEMKMKRDLAGSNGKDNFNKTEVMNPETGKTEIWSTLNGKRFEFLGLKGQDAKTNPIKTLPDAVFNPETEQFELASFDQANNKLIFHGKARPKFSPKTVTINDPYEDNPTPAVYSVNDEGKRGFKIGNASESERRTLSLEERMKLKKFEKDLKEPEVKFKQTRDLNKDREGVTTTKNTRELAEAHGKIMQTTFGKDPINDIGTIFALFKMMDPGSVVRESEQALGVKARSYDDLLNNAGPLLLKQRTLTPTQVQNIRKLADRMYQQQLQIQESSVDSQMKDRAKKYGLDANDVAPPIRSPFNGQGQKVTVERGGKQFTISYENLERVLKEDPSTKLVE